MHPSRVHGVAGHPLGTPSTIPFVCQHDLSSFGPGVRRDSPVVLGGELEVVEVETLCVHPTRRHRDDHRLGRCEQQWREQQAQLKRRHDMSGEGQFGAVRRRPVIGVHRSGAMDYSVKAGL